ncbi:hypothetical protein [Mucilaginibacter polytrichastri]|uniref:DUF8188 domain-containing protein n=1 Tax=Mucilaginibacter polytrichastri TaxID=1302689 RepID=A0A1Q6A3Q4_9SPHI|nr:hypothetical protein [Mucilaginibacter polytrichastri]OKS88636.1 hypothetical protein RG47T_4108 [Mucilaginibacter polytrichastri]SFT26390.1 hypothetical protein SAMN04487890_12517 [Mucilaginibacter polytrichastri]
MKKAFVGIAVAVGMVIGLPLYLYVVNHLFYKGNDAKAIVPVYIHNSQQFKVLVPERDPRDINSLLTYKDTSYFSKLQKNGRSDLFEIKIFSSEYKKYFEIRMFDSSPTIFLPDILSKKYVILTVNKGEWSNPLLGTRENPVPVFKYQGTSPITYGGVTYEVSEEAYKHNVTQYLSFMLTKNEFEKRFGKQAKFISLNRR